MTAKTATARVQEMRARERALGRTRRDYSLTPVEHEQLKALLKVLRGS